MDIPLYVSNRASFPSQKKPIRQKTTQWMKDCVDAAVNLTIYNPDVRLRNNKRNIRANNNLVSGIIDMRDVEETINPLGFSMANFPNAFNHYPIINNKLNVLIGEEASMMFQWRVKVINDDAVSEKEKFIKQSIIDELIAIAVSDELGKLKPLVSSTMSASISAPSSAC